MKKLIVVFLMAIMGVALVYACGSEEDDQFSGNFLEISLSCPDIEDARVLSRDFGDQRHLSEIVKLILTIDQGQPPMNSISEEFEPDDDEIMVNVPVGTDRRFTIQGVGEDGKVICKGETITDIDTDSVEVDIPCEFLIEDCTDGVDNNLDDLIDCEDPDCVDFCMDPDDDDDDQGDDDDDNNDETPTDPENCSDGIDNDGDGFTDCVDIDCIRSPVCLFPPVPPSGGCTFDPGDGGPSADCKNPACCGHPDCDDCQGVCCDEFRIPAFCSNPE